MLRRKLLLILGLLLTVLLIAAVLATLLMHNVLNDLDHIGNTALTGSTRTGILGSSITRIEAELNALRMEQEAHLDELIDQVESLQRQVEELGEFYVMRDEGRREYNRLSELLPIFTRHIGDLATTRDPTISAQHTDAAIRASTAMREEIAALGVIAQEHTKTEQQKVTAKFRWVVLGVALVFLAVINVSIIVLLRAGEIILRPVDRLVEASRRLANEEFDHRVELDRTDEFGELAHAYNNLAEQLQLNEQRKVETLHHLARTLNHELNNAIAIIDLQLKLLSRSSGGDHSMSVPLEQIHETLSRMSRTVDALTRIRRIVLTDYLEGIQMLDLERSLEEDASQRTPGCGPVAEAGAR